MVDREPATVYGLRTQADVTNAILVRKDFIVLRDSKLVIIPKPLGSSLFFCFLVQLAPGSMLLLKMKIAPLETEKAPMLGIILLVCGQNAFDFITRGVGEKLVDAPRLIGLHQFCGTCSTVNACGIVAQWV